MPWFLYGYSFDQTITSSYTIPVTSSCTGVTLCAIFTTTIPGSVPSMTLITTSVLDAIQNALDGITNINVTKLRPQF